MGEGGKPKKKKKNLKKKKKRKALGDVRVWEIST